MPIPRVICCICGQEVNKAQTLHIGEGKRACKSHEGTIESSKLELEKIARRKKDEIENTIRAKEAKQQERKRQNITVEPHCLICGKKGLRQEEWYTRYMIETKKYEITHGKPFNPLLETSPFDALNGVACLFYVLWHGENAKIKVPFDVYQLTQIQKSMGIEEPILLVCQDCVVAKRFISLSHERIERLMNDDNFFKLIGIANAVIEPEIMRTAMQEIIESN